MLTEDQIQFLNRVFKSRWTEENGVINITGNVIIVNKNLTKMPIQFSNINGYFSCYNNKLTTLKGCPDIIKNAFNCSYNQLTSLKGGPSVVGEYYYCNRNMLTSLIGAPKICNDDFYCFNNQLTSLEGCPQLIKRDLSCHSNPNLKYLWGIGRVEGAVIYENQNELNEWIIKCSRKDIIFPHFTLEENVNWIKREQKYSCLLDAPQEIRQYFSPRILHNSDSGVYNESKILDYKKFSRLC